MEKKEPIRTKEIKNLIIMIIITSVIGIALLSFYITRDKTHYIKYNENSAVDYKVFLKENEFYKENYLEKNTGYVASLIDYIEASFKYNINFDRTIQYKYSYRVVAEIDVMDEKNQNNIYHYSEDLYTKSLSRHTGDLKINQDITITYAEYNDIISKFKNIYELSSADADLNIFLYVNIENMDKTNSRALAEKKVSSLVIPLTIKTVTIDIDNSSTRSNNNRLELTRKVNYNWILWISLFYIVISVIYITYLVIYCSRTRTAQMVYQKEMRSILSNYDSYIQKINGSYDIGTSQVLKIESFNDMLEIRDTLKQPILMLENEEKDGTFFIIPATNSIIYTYALRVIDIKAKMDGKEIPTYDITEIPHSEFLKKKKYTDSYIKEQITMTQAMPTVDEKNVIQGTKDKEKLYDQLEKTSSFDINEIKRLTKQMKKIEKKELSKKKTKKRINAGKTAFQSQKNKEQ